MTIRPLGAELFHADVDTHGKANSRFRSYGNAPKMDQQTGGTTPGDEFSDQLRDHQFLKKHYILLRIDHQSVNESNQFNMLVIITFAYYCFHRRT
jgi:hypothetical protein